MGYVDKGHEDQNRIEKGNRFGWVFALIVGVILVVGLIVFSM